MEGLRVRQELVAGSLPSDRVVLWLGFLRVREVVALKCCCRLLSKIFEDVELLVNDELWETSSKMLRLQTVSLARPRLLYCYDFLSEIESRAIVALGRLAFSLPFTAARKLGSRCLRHKYYLGLKSGSQDSYLPPSCLKLLKAIERRVSALTNSKEDDSDFFDLQIHYTPGALRTKRPRNNAKMWSESGLHVDVNNGFPHRYATALAYLNDVPVSGATAFPCVHNPKARGLAEKILDTYKIHHTDAAFLQKNEALFAAAAGLIAEADNNKSFQPTRGSLVLFWSLTDDGRLDAASYHGGARVVHDEAQRDFWHTGKWTLQCFKQLPPHLQGEGEDKNRFLRASRHCLRGEAPGVRFQVLDDDAPSSSEGRSE